MPGTRCWYLIPVAGTTLYYTQVLYQVLHVRVFNKYPVAWPVVQYSHLVPAHITTAGAVVFAFIIPGMTYQYVRSSLDYTLLHVTAPLQVPVVFKINKQLLEITTVCLLAFLAQLRSRVIIPVFLNTSTYIYIHSLFWCIRVLLVLSVSTHQYTW